MNSSNLINDQLQDCITDARFELLRIKKQREKARTIFTENQIEYAERQQYCFQGLQWLGQHPKVAVPPQYTHALRSLSNADYSPYAIARETEVCRALHQVEIHSIQLDLIREHHTNLIQSMKKSFDEEIALSEKIEDPLLRNIKLVSTAMSEKKMENKRHKLSQLSGESPRAKDASGLFNFQENKKVGSGSSSFSESFRIRKKIDRENRRMGIEQRITKAASYLGAVQTATAA